MLNGLGKPGTKGHRQYTVNSKHPEFRGQKGVNGSDFPIRYNFVILREMPRTRTFISLVYLLTGTVSLIAEPILRAGQIHRPVTGRNGAVPAAAGLEVLKNGGNAVDAAVTVGFCLAVTLPRAGNIGGGGFLLYHDGQSGQSHALDYREVAPHKAHHDMFLDAEVNVDPELSRYSPLASGVPGTVAGLIEAHRRFGTLPLADLMAPAIRLAREGFPVHEALREQFTNVAQMLKLLENFPLGQRGHNSAQSTHITVEVMKRAYADRSKFLGDPDFFEVPGNQAMDMESPETTQFFIVDAWGNAVSNTYTLNFSFGSGIMTHSTGILLNNEMDDFSAKSGVPNAYGLIGGEANSVEPGKRPLSSMTPTLILRDGSIHGVTGSPGDSRIINTVLQVILNLLVYEMNFAEANNAPRFHHQWLPDILRIERGFPSDTLRMLKELGYQTETSYTIGTAQTIVRHEEGLLSVASDPRRLGGTALAY